MSESSETTPTSDQPHAPRPEPPPLEVEELAPDGGPLAASPARAAHVEAHAPDAAHVEAHVEHHEPHAPHVAPPAEAPAAAHADEPEAAAEEAPAAAKPARPPAKRPPRAPKVVVQKPKEVAAPAVYAPGVTVDDDEKIEHVWYVLKVQSSREDTIRDSLERRVKILGLTPYFGRMVVPTEKITEIRNNKKRIVERKTLPGYIMVEMELNEKTWYAVRETPGIGDFVGGARGNAAEPWKHATQMTETEVNQMLGQETAKTEEAPRVRIDVERGDRVKIKDGPFENFEGTVEEVIEQRGLVKVMLIIFNRPTPVDLEYWQVERL